MGAQHHILKDEILLDRADGECYNWRCSREPGYETYQGRPLCLPLFTLARQDETDIAPETLYVEATRPSPPNCMKSRRKPSVNKRATLMVSGISC